VHGLLHDLSTKKKNGGEGKTTGERKRTGGSNLGRERAQSGVGKVRRMIDFKRVNLDRDRVFANEQQNKRFFTTVGETEQLRKEPEGKMSTEGKKGFYMIGFGGGRRDRMIEDKYRQDRRGKIPRLAEQKRTWDDLRKKPREITRRGTKK